MKCIGRASHGATCGEAFASRGNEEGYALATEAARPHPSPWALAPSRIAATSCGLVFRAAAEPLGRLVPALPGPCDRRFRVRERPAEVFPGTTASRIPLYKGGKAR